VRPWYAEAIEWDDGNESELARHEVSAEEVVQLLANDPVWVPNKRRRAGDWKVVGYTDGGRALTVVLHWDERRVVLRPITGWDCSSEETTKYLGGR